MSTRAVSLSSRIRITCDFQNEIAERLRKLAEDVQQQRAQTSALLAQIGQWDEKSLDLFKEGAANLIRLQARADELEWVLRAAGIVQQPEANTRESKAGAS